MMHLRLNAPLTVNVTRTERDEIVRLAARDRQSVSNFIRQCINGALLESGEAMILQDAPKFWRLYDPAVASRAKSLHSAGLSVRRIAQQLGCSSSCVHRWVKQEEKVSAKDCSSAHDVGALTR